MKCLNSKYYKMLVITFFICCANVFAVKLYLELESEISKPIYPFFALQAWYSDGNMVEDQKPTPLSLPLYSKEHHPTCINIPSKSGVSSLSEIKLVVGYRLSYLPTVITRPVKNATYYKAKNEIK